MKARRARPEDAEESARILAAVAAEGFLWTEPPVDIAARAECFRKVIEGEEAGALWVLEDGARIVGHGGLQPTRVDGVLGVGMAILRDFRGRGGGRMLLDALIADAPAHGAHKLELELWPENTAAFGLYRAAGFEVEGLRRDHYPRRNGSLRSAVLMGLVLGLPEGR